MLMLWVYGSYLTPNFLGILSVNLLRTKIEMKNRSIDNSIKREWKEELPILPPLYCIYNNLLFRMADRVS